MGSNTKIIIDEIRTSRILVERSPDKICITHSISPTDNSQISSKEVLSSTVVATRRSIPTHYLPVNDDRSLPSGFDKIRDFFFHTVYTDGSWAKQHTLSSLLLNTSKIKSAGAIVLHSTRGLFTIKVEMDIPIGSAYDAEVVSLLLAHEMSYKRSVEIWSDCNFAIKCLNGGGFGPYIQLLSG
jgi:hypothetical protein